MKICCGIENEYAVPPAPLPGHSLSGAVLEAALKRIPSVPFDGGGGGHMLANGGRCYVDAGDHLEYASPECENPLELVAAVEAGHRLMAAAAGSLARRFGETIRLARANVDYSSGSAWGSHENYSVSSDLFRAKRLSGWLWPHLASRILLIGSGGFKCSPETGVEGLFVLSPRACFIRVAEGTSSQRARPLLHHKEKPLAAGLQRCHLLCSEASLSQRSLYLRVGTTMLLVLLAELGEEPPFTLEDPVGALWGINERPFAHRTRAGGGALLTGLEIQEALCDVVERRLSDLPEWAIEVVNQWRKSLACLAALSAGQVVPMGDLPDWARKRRLFQTCLERRNASSLFFDWFVGVEDEEQRRDGSLDRTSLLPLCEMDWRLSEIGYEVCPDSGEPLVASEAIDKATQLPPAGSERASFRGNAIRELADRVSNGSPGRVAGNWSRLVDLNGGRTLNLSRLFPSRAPQWTNLSRPERQEFEPRRRAPERRRSRAAAEASSTVNNTVEILSLIREGHVRKAVRQLKRLSTLREDPHAMRLTSWALAYSGCYTEAMSYSELAHAGLDLEPLRAVNDRLILARHECLRPTDRYRDLLEMGARLESDSSDPVSMFIFGAHRAYGLLLAGDLAGALHFAGTIPVEAEILATSFGHIGGRACADMAEVCRLLNRSNQVFRWLERAETIQRRERTYSDLAALSLTCRAKALWDCRMASAACKTLAEVNRIQRPQKNEFLLARTVLLRARMSKASPDSPGNRRRLETLLRFQENVPALQNCPTFARITESGQWETWCEGGQEPDEKDFFWGI